MKLQACNEVPSIAKTFEVLACRCAAQLGYLSIVLKPERRIMRHVAKRSAVELTLICNYMTQPKSGWSVKLKGTPTMDFVIPFPA